MAMLETLKALCALPGVSGSEHPVREEIIRRIDSTCDWQVDALGNLLAHKKGQQKPANTLLFSAHMDEVGFIITFAEESGLLRFATVGGIDTRVIIGKPVLIGEKQVYGVIGAKAVHLQEEDEKSNPPKAEKLYIDIGAATKEEALAHVCPGDRAIFAAPFVALGGGKVMGRALDDRAGCALLLEMMEQELAYDCWFSFTVQEETGCTGAKAAGYTIAPDRAVAVDTTTASDIPGVPPEKIVCRVGNGPVLSFMDRGTVYDMEMYRLSCKTAEGLGIPYQSKEGVFGGNESRSLQTAGAGAKVLGVSLPCRYLHSPSNLLQVSDMEHTLTLLRALVKELADS
ncbi:M42 family peptidase [Oscillospiraceae bacterium MB08-C2-2]|nr:M42 family peptidase [Oscillospiraceae bacterium MB08-C2-2]